MIHVEPAIEPPHFDEQVRQPGLSELEVMTGGVGWVARRGPKRKQLVIDGVPVTRIEDIPGDRLPDYWTRALPDMCECYDRICAYTCVYIERVTGAPTIDHWIAKSLDPRKAYDWRNFRLVCSLFNSKKGKQTGLRDPFAVEDGEFALEFANFEIVPGDQADSPAFLDDQTYDRAGGPRSQSIRVSKAARRIRD